MIALRALSVVAGIFIILSVLMSAVRTVIVPRAVPVRLGRRVFRTMRWVFELRVGRDASYTRRDRIFALYAPTTLLVLLVVWVLLEFAGYTLVYLGLNVTPLSHAVTVSGSALLTLGLVHPEALGPTIVSFTEAAAGLILLALLISYLPTLYGVFSRREAAVTSLESRAGAPPSAVEFLERLWRIEFFDHLTDVWTRWEDWFVEIAETHTSFAVMSFFRSPEPDHSWVTAAGTVLDTAALSVSLIDRPRDPRAELTIRAGYLALRRIAAFFRIGYNPDPRPDDPISIARAEFDAVAERLAAAGVPLKRDRDQAWRDFAGWRVNYDTVLLELAALTQAPPSPWTSDRSAVVTEHGRRRMERHTATGATVTSGPSPAPEGDR
ncbi:MAG: hypothetical protein WAT66_16375 [Actinomycetota bacterium]